MMPLQQSLDRAALYRWQELRRPQEQIERLMTDFFQPPLVSDAEYEATLRNVSEAMQ